MHSWNRIAFIVLVYGLARGPSLFAAEPSDSGRVIVLEHCLVRAKHDVEIPALRTGRLKKVLCDEGARVEAGQMLGQIDDAEAALQLSFAEAEKGAARKKADSKLEEQYSQTAHDVSVAERDAAVEANKAFSNSVSEIEVLRLNLAMNQASLQVALNRFKREVQGVELGMVDAKAGLALADVELRQIRAPFAGEIVSVASDPGEWVEAGATVFRIVAAERLRVEGFVKVEDAPPVELFGKPVTVSIAFGRSEPQTFEGTIGFVSPVVEAGNQYRVWADVVNRSDQGRWIMRPGMHARMAIRR